MPIRLSKSLVLLALTLITLLAIVQAAPPFPSSKAGTDLDSSLDDPASSKTPLTTDEDEFASDDGDAFDGVTAWGEESSLNEDDKKDFTIDKVNEDLDDNVEEFGTSDDSSLEKIDTDNLDSPISEDDGLDTFDDPIPGDDEGDELDSSDSPAEDNAADALDADAEDFPFDGDNNEQDVDNSPPSDDNENIGTEENVDGTEMSDKETVDNNEDIPDDGHDDLEDGNDDADPAKYVVGSDDNEEIVPPADGETDESDDFTPPLTGDDDDSKDEEDTGLPVDGETNSNGDDDDLFGLEDEVDPEANENETGLDNLDDETDEIDTGDDIDEDSTDELDNNNEEDTDNVADEDDLEKVDAKEDDISKAGDKEAADDNEDGFEMPPDDKEDHIADPDSDNDTGADDDNDINSDDGEDATGAEDDNDTDADDGEDTTEDDGLNTGKLFGDDATDKEVADDEVKEDDGLTTGDKSEEDSTDKDVANVDKEQTFPGDKAELEEDKEDDAKLPQTGSDSDDIDEDPMDKEEVVPTKYTGTTDMEDFESGKGSEAADDNDSTDYGTTKATPPTGSGHVKYQGALLIAGVGIVGLLVVKRSRDTIVQVTIHSKCFHVFVYLFLNNSLFLPYYLGRAKAYWTSEPSWKLQPLAGKSSFFLESYLLPLVWVYQLIYYHLFLVEHDR